MTRPARSPTLSRRALGAGMLLAAGAALAGVTLTQRAEPPASRLRFLLDLRTITSGDGRRTYQPRLVLGDADLVAVNWAEQRYTWPAQYVPHYVGAQATVARHCDFAAYFDDVFLFGGALRPYISASRVTGIVMTIHDVAVKPLANGDVQLQRRPPDFPFSFMLRTVPSPGAASTFPCPDAQRSEQVRAYLASLGKLTPA
jgi:hypothetical protein